MTNVADTYLCIASLVSLMGPAISEKQAKQELIKLIIQLINQLGSKQTLLSLGYQDVCCVWLFFVVVFFTKILIRTLQARIMATLKTPTSPKSVAFSLPLNQVCVYVCPCMCIHSMFVVCCV
jgi:hypothetical protein